VAATKAQEPWYLSLALDLAAKVEGAAAVAKEALPGVTGLGDCESTTFMLLKGIQCVLQDDVYRLSTITVYNKVEETVLGLRLLLRGKPKRSSKACI
jgi:hypothetical protein